MKKSLDNEFCFLEYIRMEPASRIIKLLGGEPTVAKITGTTVTAPYRWQYPRERGGTAGQIPGKHIPPLLARAKALGLALTADDFFSAQDSSGGGWPHPEGTK